MLASWKPCFWLVSNAPQQYFHRKKLPGYNHTSVLQAFYPLTSVDELTSLYTSLCINHLEMLKHGILFNGLLDLLSGILRGLLHWF